MREIKTVIQPIERVECFDAIVNSFLIDGWVLVKRETKNLPGEMGDSFSFPVVHVLYAELERWEPIRHEEITV